MPNNRISKDQSKSEHGYKDKIGAVSFPARFKLWLLKVRSPTMKIVDLFYNRDENLF